MDRRFGMGLWAPAPRPAYHHAGQRGEEEEGGQGHWTRNGTPSQADRDAPTAGDTPPTGIRPRPADGTGIRAPRARRGNPRNQVQISPATFVASARDVGRRMGGVASMREKRETSRRIWCEAMSELGVPVEQWMLFSEVRRVGRTASQPTRPGLHHGHAE